MKDLKYKLTLIGFLAVTILAGVVASLHTIAPETTSVSSQETPQETPGVGIGLSTYYCVEFKPSESDEWKDYGCVHNVFTDAGKEHVEGLLGGTITTNEAMKYLALGNGTAPVAGSTTLNLEQGNDCNLTRRLGDYFDKGTGWWEVNTTFSYNCSTQTVVNTTASFNAATSGTMLAGGTITAVTFTTSGDQLRLRHNNTISEA